MPTLQIGVPALPPPPLHWLNALNHLQRNLGTFHSLFLSRREEVQILHSTLSPVDVHSEHAWGLP